MMEERKTTETSETAVVIEDQPSKGTTMNVYTALSKRKILQKQLDEVLSSRSSGVCAAVMANADKIDGKDRETAINDMKAAYDRPKSLIKNIAAINSAIAISNATTKCTVGGKEYTVEELLFRMIHLNDEVKFYNSIVADLNNAKIAIENNRVKNLSESVITDHVNKILPTLVPADASVETRDIKAKDIRDTYVKNMTMELVDPYDLLNKVEGILRELSEFKEEVDNALNLCNIQTTITVLLEG